MSWGINVVGTKEGVLKRLRESKVSYGDPAQFESVKPLLIAEVEATPVNESGQFPEGIKVDAGGHHDTTSRNLSISIGKISLAV